MVAHTLSILSFLGSTGVYTRKKQATAVFLPGKSHGQRSLVGYSPWGGQSTGWETSEGLTLSLSGV